MLNVSNLCVGVVHWQANDGIASQFSLGLEHLGCKVVNLSWDARLPQELDIIVAYGPFGSLVPLANQLLAYPLSQRPSFIYWMTEQLPNPNLPEWFRYWAGLIRSRTARLAFRQQAEGEWRLVPWSRWLTARFHRFGYYGDLYWLQRHGILSVLSIVSPWTADFLRARGFEPTVMPLSYNPAHGKNLGLERDIPVLWIGKIGSARRGRLLKRIRSDLRARGIEILMVDGVENPYVFGGERTTLLNRTKIVLNLLRQDWDDNSMRHKLAASNGALIITEPTLPHTQFMSGVHLVEATIDKMADTICYYLSHEEERKQIAERAYQLLAEHSGLEILAKVIEKSVIARQAAVSRLK